MNLKSISAFAVGVLLIVIMFNLHQWIGYRFDRDIQTPRMMETVKMLNDGTKMGDRQAGKPGNQATAQYIANQFEKMGLQKLKGSSSYLQPVSDGVNNVVGVIQGSEDDGDISLVLMTHFDTAPGATEAQSLSDTSGVATLLETAAVLTGGKEGYIKPKKTLVFVAVNGQYQGSTGALSFAEHKYYSQEKMKILLLEDLGRNTKGGLDVGVVKDNVAGMMIQDRFIICSNDIGMNANRSEMTKGDGPALANKEFAVTEIRSAGSNVALTGINDLSEKSFKQVVRAILRLIDQTCL